MGKILMDTKVFYTELEDLVRKGADDNSIEKFLKTNINAADEGKDYVFYLAACNELLGLYKSQKKYDNAFIVCEDILVLMDDLNQTESIAFADALVTVGSTYREAGRISEAMNYYTQAFNVYDDLDQKECDSDLHFLEGCLGFGETNYMMGEKSKAINYYEKAAAAVKNTYGENQTYQAIVSNIISVCNGAGDTEKSAYYQEILARI